MEKDRLLYYVRRGATHNKALKLFAALTGILKMLRALA